MMEKRLQEPNAMHPPRVKCFVESVRHPQSGGTHLINTYGREERPCWFLLKASERNLIRLEQTSYDDIIDLTQYGEIVASGWGHKRA